MATYLADVRALSKSTSSETSDANVVTFLNAGAIYVVNGLPKDLLSFMATDSLAIVDGSGYDVLNDRIVMVRRNGIVCDQLPDTQIYAHSGALSTVSLFAGSSIFPKWYIVNGKAYIKPDPSVSQVGYVTKVTPPAIGSGTTTTALDEIKNPIILYAAALDCMALSGYWSASALSDINSTSGDPRDALDKARVLIDDSTALSQGEDAEFHLNQEDPELIAASVQMASQEVTRALAELRLSESTGSLTGQILQRSQLLFAQAERELTMYVERNSKILGLRIASQAKQE